jgi:hypothetical protein
MKLLLPAVNEPIEETINNESGKSVYVMLVYSKGPIQSGYTKSGPYNTRQTVVDIKCTHMY